jgi:hypothetical protein
MIVAQRIDGDSRQGIEVGLALLVEQAATLPVGKGDRQAPVGIHQMRHESTPPPSASKPQTKSSTQKTYGGRRATRPPCLKTPLY